MNPKEHWPHGPRGREGTGEAGWTERERGVGRQERLRALETRRHRSGGQYCQKQHVGPGKHGLKNTSFKSQETPGHYAETLISGVVRTEMGSQQLRIK